MSGGRLAAFIARHKLHTNGLPVSLSGLHTIYQIHYTTLYDGLLGFGFFRSGLRLIGIDANLSPPMRRMVIAHEICHHVLRHHNSFFLCRSDGWWYTHLEAQASHGAAEILLPPGQLMIYLARGLTTRELADIYEVPEELVQRRVRMADFVPRLPPRLLAMAERDFCSLANAKR